MEAGCEGRSRSRTRRKILEGESPSLRCLPGARSRGPGDDRRLRKARKFVAKRALTARAAGVGSTTGLDQERLIPGGVFLSVWTVFPAEPDRRDYAFAVSEAIAEEVSVARSRAASRRRPLAVCHGHPGKIGALPFACPGPAAREMPGCEASRRVREDARRVFRAGSRAQGGSFHHQVAQSHPELRRRRRLGCAAREDGHVGLTFLCCVPSRSQGRQGFFGEGDEE